MIGCYQFPFQLAKGQDTAAVRDSSIKLGGRRANGATSSNRVAVWAKEDPRMKAYHASLRGHGHPYPPGIHGAIGGHPFGNLRLPPAPAPAKASTMDLVTEFEEGMRRVEAWPSEG